MTSIRFGFYASLLLVLFLGVAMGPQGVQSFVPTVSHSRLNTISLGESEGSSETEVSAEEDSTPPPQPVKCPDCDMCDGSGRIEGGIGTVLKFWPIKAYRPCPRFIENGGFYARSGQGLDEIAFGRDSKYDPME
uniref:Uncharacterized protein n=1 Tax=Pseudo-nitzschia arenysensis TaxID=697910 RepID=A0A7R9ZUH7_9STRA|mmetsp:Transcript_825/g.1932  ORF Transcript_825/g.1932 Transcript_825/m.1932 type:complete len:134 (+) Transcript_825:122-523(+)